MTGSDPGIAPDSLCFSALLRPVNDRSLLLEGGSELAVRLVERSGRVTGGPLDGTRLTEWGMHEIAPDYGEGQGFLAFEHSAGDKAYFRFQWSGRGVVTASGELRPVMFGAWTVHSGSGGFAALAGAGTVEIAIPSEQERYWQFSGALSL